MSSYSLPQFDDVMREGVTTDLATGPALLVARAAVFALAAVCSMPGQPPEARLLLDQARVAEAAGQYGRMGSLAREAEALCAKANDVRCRADAANLAGSAHYFLGEYDAALRQYDSALKNYGVLDDRERQVYVLNNTGSILLVRGRYPEAYRAYSDAAALCERNREASWHAEADRLTTANMAVLLQRLGKHAEALRLYQKLRSLAGPQPASEQAQWLSNLGTLIRRLGDPEKALDHYRMALSLYEREKHLDGQLGALKNIGIVQVSDLDDARSAVAAFEQVLRKASTAGNRREALQARLYLAEALFRRGEAARAETEWLTAVEESRALALPEEQWKAEYGLGRAARQRSDGGAARRHIEAAAQIIESVRGELSSGTLAGAFLGDKRAVFDERVSLELEGEKPDPGEMARWIEKARERGIQDTLKAPGLDLPAYQRRLPPDAAALIYWTRGDELAALRLTPTEITIHRKRLPAGSLKFLAQDLRAWERPGAGDWRTASRRWGTILLGGVLPPGGRGIERVLVIPDGWMTRIPFEALEHPEDGRLVVQGFEIRYAPALRLAMREPAQRGWSLPWSFQAAAVGAPSTTGLPGYEEARPLAAAPEELRAVAAMLKGRVETFEGAGATRTNLLASLRGAPVVHLATHAVADAEDPKRSRMLLSAERGDPATAYLYLDDVRALDLHNLSLVTLSACETDRGRLAAGEGVESFSRAFLGAGAESVVATLWPVEDRATAEFMKQFYFALGKGAGRAAALREAKLRFLEGPPDRGSRHPAQWAAFVIYGEGSAPVPRVAGWPWILATAGGLAALGGLASLARRQS